MLFLSFMHKTHSCYAQIGHKIVKTAKSVSSSLVVPNKFDLPSSFSAQLKKRLPPIQTFFA